MATPSMKCYRAAMLTTLRQARTGYAQWLLALALLAVGTQASLPKGFMLDRNAQTGAFSIVFCTGYGPERRWIDLSSGDMTAQAPDGAGTTHDGNCTFAAAQALALDASATDLARPALTQTAAAPLRPSGLPGDARDYLHPPTRAPPTSV